MKIDTLKNLANFIGSGCTPSRKNISYWNSKDVLWLKTEQLGEYKITSTSEYISHNAVTECNLRIYPKNTISVAMYGEGKTRGNVSLLGAPMTTNQACCNIEIDDTKIDYRYVYYYLKGQYENLRQMSAGVRKNLNADDIKNFIIRYPEDKVTQKKIAALLGALDDKIALNKKINATLEAMAKTLYDYWFVQFDFPDENGKPYKTSGGKMIYSSELGRDIPIDWELGKLSKLIKSVTTGLNPRDNFVLNTGGDIKYVTVKNLTLDGRIDFSNCDCVDEDARNLIHERSNISKGDVLFASIAPIGRCFLIQEEPCNWEINESVFSIRPSNFTTSEFLYMYLKSNGFVKLASSSSTGSIFKGIRINTLMETPTVIPPKNISEQFKNKLSKLLSKLNQSDEESRRLAELRDWLLPMLMNGQVKFKET